MAKTTKQLSGGGKDKFLRATITREIALDPIIAGRLGDALCQAITEIRVRREAWKPSGEDLPQILAEPSPRPIGTLAAETVAFDPFVFSALSVLAKQGSSALREKLATIASVEHLRLLASAQHLALDESVSGLGEIREAILQATESRLAQRRAAAS